MKLARGYDLIDPPTARLGGDDGLRCALTAVGDVHQVALYSADPAKTRRAYLRVWLASQRLVQRVDPSTHTVEFAQALMFAHDAAQVMNHHQLALLYARTATLALSEWGGRSDEAVRLRLNALFAEVVTLNSLGLKRDALDLALRARIEPNYSWEPRTWARSFLEEELTAMVSTPRLSIYAAEETADRALETINGDSVHTNTINAKLLEVYLSHGSMRSLRRAKRLSERIDLSPMKVGSTLRQVRALRALARYHRAIGDQVTAHEYLRRCRELAEAGQLRHQLIRLKCQRTLE